MCLGFVDVLGWWVVGGLGGGWGVHVGVGVVGWVGVVPVGVVVGGRSW